VSVRPQWPLLPLAVSGASHVLLVFNIAALKISIESIVEALEIGSSAVKSALIAYSLVVAACILIGARLAAVVGSRRIFRGALALFGGAMVAMAASVDSMTLLVAQTVAGAAAAAPHLVAVLALDGFVPSDLSTPLDLFGWARLRDGAPAYRTLVCAPRASVRAAGDLFALRAPHRLDALALADTIVVPGVRDPLAPAPPAGRGSPPSASAPSRSRRPACSTGCARRPTGAAPPSWRGATRRSRSTRTSSTSTTASC